MNLWINFHFANYMPKPSRHNARILAFQTIYCRHKLGVNPRGESHLLIESGLKGKYKDFSKALVTATWDRLDRIDSIIQNNLKNWKQARISDSLHFPQVDFQLSNST